jgi:uncharacterized protein YoxC
VDEFIKLAQVVALLSASALCLYLIVVLVRLNKLMESVQRDLSEITRGLKPVLENLTAITDKIKSITDKINDQVDAFQTIFGTFRRIAENVIRFEERVQRRLEEPLFRVAGILGGLVNRIASFFGLSSSRAD